MRGHRQHAALIESWLELLPLQQQANARALHQLVLRIAPEFEVSLRTGSAVYSLHGNHVLALAPFRTHLHLQVFRPGPLLGRFPELDGSGRGPRQLRLRHGQQFDALLVESLVRAAAADAAVSVPARRDH